jgi:hypothetical protein
MEIAFLKLAASLPAYISPAVKTAGLSLLETWF